ncbi:MAG TPA: M23 family metallopeptidase [Candidatus Dormibacteraeota bacterium]|nr:M23 family metallopeptidase [Candidatus Dormibacteraeota bacterium]
MISIVWAGDKAITQPWGITDVTVEPWFDLPSGRVHWHTGIDIGLYFEPINAARAGKVAYVTYGLLCVQVGDEVDWYVHIDHAEVAVGADVARGQRIGVSGDKVPSGGSLDGAHLHFETRSGPLWLPGGLNLNIPTGNDPVPVLTGLFGGLGGADDMTPEEHAWLQEVYSEVRGNKPYANLDEIMGADPADLSSLPAILKAVQAVSTLPAAKVDIPALAAALTPLIKPVDLAPVLAAIGAEHDAVAALATAIANGDAELDTALGNLSTAVADVKTHVAHLT